MNLKETIITLLKCVLGKLIPLDLVLIDLTLCFVKNLLFLIFVHNL